MSAAEKLLDALTAYLQAEIYSKSDSDVTKGDELVIATCNTLQGLVLRRHAFSQPHQASASSLHREDQMAHGVTEVLKAYSDAHLEDDLRRGDIRAIDLLRSGGRRNGNG